MTKTWGLRLLLLFTMAVGVELMDGVQRGSMKVLSVLVHSSSHVLTF